MKVRINKFLADSGICSRRQADEHILSGKVTINGGLAKPGDMVGVADEIQFCGKTVSKAESEYEYWVVNKPLGVVTTVQDEKGRKKITDLVKSNTRIFPVGRLDINTGGLIILTNDGELTNILTHPSYEHKKRYRLIARRLKPVSDQEIIRSFEKGIRIEDRIMRVHRVTSLGYSDENSFLEIDLELITGYNRQIRRMCDKIGLEVKKLTRTGMGKLDLNRLNLEPGQSKRISRNDII